uniref:Uncharacterized protein n=1 Tax=Opuntia streptacantha TaxID=393608 RepID=A0A7C9EH88_OPUST
MPSRKRKKPPDLPLLSLHSFICHSHAFPPDLPVISLRSLFLSLGVRRFFGGAQCTGLAHTLDFRFLFECATADRSRSVTIGGADASPCPNSSLGVTIGIIAALFCHRIAAGYGKVVLEHCLSSRSDEGAYTT